MSPRNPPSQSPVSRILGSLFPAFNVPRRQPVAADELSEIVRRVREAQSLYAATCKRAGIVERYYRKADQSWLTIADAARSEQQGRNAGWLKVSYASSRLECAGAALSFMTTDDSQILSELRSALVQHARFSEFSGVRRRDDSTEGERLLLSVMKRRRDFEFKKAKWAWETFHAEAGVKGPAIAESAIDMQQVANWAVRGAKSALAAPTYVVDIEDFRGFCNSVDAPHLQVRSTEPVFVAFVRDLDELHLDEVRRTFAVLQLPNGFTGKLVGLRDSAAPTQLFLATEQAHVYQRLAEYLAASRMTKTDSPYGSILTCQAGTWREFAIDRESASVAFDRARTSLGNDEVKSAEAAGASREGLV